MFGSYRLIVIVWMTNGTSLLIYELWLICGVAQVASLTHMCQRGDLFDKKLLPSTWNQNAIQPFRSRN